MRQRNQIPYIKIFLVTILLFTFLGQTALADVSPGDVIDKSNFQKVQGIVPDLILDWIKKGDLVLNIDRLNFNPIEGFLPSVSENLKKNVGKYGVGKRGELIDPKTGRFPSDIIGMPFPEVDEKDPNAGAKIVNNMRFIRQSLGNINFDVQTSWVGASGFERSIVFKYYEFKYTANPGTKNVPNPDGLLRTNVLKIIHPYDLAGTAVMLWSYENPDREDQNFAYVPAIRRVRRTSPASRSDALFGSDQCIDDNGAYEGTTEAMDWKVIGTREALFPFKNKDWLRIRANEDGSFTNFIDIKDQPALKYGYEVKGWNRAPWVPTNTIWVKRKVYLIEAKPRDPYYNYGRQIFWFDVETFLPVYKEIYDRANNYWKTIILIAAGMATPDGKLKYYDNTVSQVTYDSRRNHATVLRLDPPTGRCIWHATNVKVDDFTLTGFQKFCK